MKRLALLLLVAAPLVAAFTCTTPVPPAFAGATSVLGFGANWHGQLSSTNRVESTPRPVIVGSSSVNVSKINGGYMHVAVLDAASNVAFFAGKSTNGQVGGGPTVLTSQTQYLPVPFVIDVNAPEVFNRPVYAAAAGFAHSCIVAQKVNQTAAHGVVYCAGKNDKGQLGRSDFTEISYIVPTVPVDPAFTDSNIIDVAAGADHTLALSSRNGGELWAWGSNSYGELGNGQTVDSTTPVRVNGLRNIVKIACGINYCAALESTGALYGWGMNNEGQLGGASTDLAVPTPTIIANGVSDFACGGAHMLAVINGRLNAWGSGTMGATGLPKNIPPHVREKWTVTTPTPLADFANVNVRSIAAGAKHSVVLDACGKVYTFGSDAVGQLGRGSLTPKAQSFRSLVALENTAIANRGVVPVAVYASWFNTFVVTEESFV